MNNDSPDTEAPLTAHLEALRSTVIRCLVITAAAYPLCYWGADQVTAFLVRRCFPPELGVLHYFSPMEAFTVKLKLSAVLALALAYPLNIRQLWKFVLPALYEKERRTLGMWIVFSSVLFFCGVAFCGLVMLPLVMKFAAGFASPELKPVIGLADFLGFAGWLLLASGLLFQTPVAVLLAVRFGLVSTEWLSRRRPHAIVIILILAAVLTPPDVLSQLLLALPAWLLFETGLLLARGIEKRREK